MTTMEANVASEFTDTVEIYLFETGGTRVLLDGGEPLRATIPGCEAGTILNSPQYIARALLATKFPSMTAVLADYKLECVCVHQGVDSDVWALRAFFPTEVFEKLLAAAPHSVFAIPLPRSNRTAGWMTMMLSDPDTWRNAFPVEFTNETANLAMGLEGSHNTPPDSVPPPDAQHPDSGQPMTVVDDVFGPEPALPLRQTEEHHVAEKVGIRSDRTGDVPQPLQEE